MVQTLIVVAIVAIALLFVARRLWAAVRPARDAGCAHGCGCGPAAGQSSSDWSKT